MSLSAGSMHAGHTVDDDQIEPAGPSGQVIDVHDVNTVPTGANLRVRYGLSKWLLTEVSLPVRMVFMNPEFRDADGAAAPAAESIHHRKEATVGVGDLKLMAVLPLRTDPHSAMLAVRVGLTVPTGHTEPDPFALGRQGKTHQHIFFGSGTVDPVLALEVAKLSGAFLFTGQAEGRIPVYAGQYGYRQGVRASAQLGIHYLLDDWRFGVHPGLYAETASKWGDAAADNSGRVDALTSVSAGWTPSSGPAWSLTLGKPFTLWTDGGQFDTDIQATLSTGWTFGGDSADPAADDPPQAP